MTPCPQNRLRYSHYLDILMLIHILIFCLSICFLCFDFLTLFRIKIQVDSGAGRHQRRAPRAAVVVKKEKKKEGGKKEKREKEKDFDNFRSKIH